MLGCEKVVRLDQDVEGLYQFGSSRGSQAVKIRGRTAFQGSWKYLALFRRSQTRWFITFREIVKVCSVGFGPCLASWNSCSFQLHAADRLRSLGL